MQQYAVEECIFKGIPFEGLKFEIQSVALIRLNFSRWKTKFAMFHPKIPSTPHAAFHHFLCTEKISDKLVM